MKFGSEKAQLMEVNEHFERLSLTYPYLGSGVQDNFCIQLDLKKKGRLLLDSGLMADLCNYPSEIDMDGRMLGANTGGEHKVRPYAPPNVGANLVFAHYA
uniref:Uncharacterized protein n=2 Tax=Candidatus Kentrum sp. FM TaxID=2126340 RepID=A0A450TNS8_9GAMM|nr:MAG: hypothetical protein BECKFM1743C_GA0114222_105053 [Candidatus Kentron sp. FM]VFJ69493.1 MAG: hypothetical protein BECKFM1743A_GA0114220_105123 [Candidatus Kentron sp. FM]VFK17720.1 MAG: hypothetical protein BECKFM1743B_GA0114221_104993 [Candidatus Kentron sp. FM]